MNYTFSDKMATLKPSAIREILKVTSLPGVISFAAGNPAPETFPAAEMEKIADDLLTHSAGKALQYGVTEGYTELRDLTAKRLKERYDIGTQDDMLIITSGGQQAIDLFARVMLNEGDTVLCENPSIIGALNAFRSYNANLVGIDMDDEGVDLNKLEHALKTEKNVRFMYLIPTFQNPSGRTMSLARRRAVLALAEKYGVMILEDNPYFELRYSGEPVPAIKSLDKNGMVLYAGTYSKIMSPGIRIGMACGPEPVINKMVVAKQVNDVHTNLFFSMVVAEYLKRYDLDAHIEEIRGVYRVRRDAMLSALERALGGTGCTWTQPEGGLFIWASLPKGCDSMELMRRLGEYKVAAVPGASFMVDANAPCAGYRMNFSLPTLDEIARGVEILGDVTKKFLAEKK